MENTNIFLNLHKVLKQLLKYLLQNNTFKALA